MSSRSRILQAQSALLSAIYQHHENRDFEKQGLAAYQRSLAANAKRALTISYPTVAQLLGEAFPAMSQDFLRDHPLTGGDWGEWGCQLPAWLTSKPALAHYAYLGDCARLDWLCHQSERAANVTAEPDSLTRLASADACQLKLQLASGTFLLDSRHPIVDIWHAHQAASQNAHQADNLFKLAAQGIASHTAQIALIWRPHWKAQVQSIDASEFLWLQQLLAGESLGSALDNVSHTDFDFERWLPRALQQGLFFGIKPAA